MNIYTKRFKKKFPLLNLKTFFVLLLLVPALVFAIDPGVLKGAAWSDNIGWISMSSDTVNDPVSYAVSADSNGMLKGFAWSSNMGWVKFGDLTGFPSGVGTISTNAQIQGSKVVGWARACGGAIKDDCSGGNIAGWDGWISLSGGTGASAYSVTYDDSSKSFNGYGWGSSFVGWVSFRNVSLDTTDTKCLSASAEPQTLNFNSGPINGTSVATFKYSMKTTPVYSISLASKLPFTSILNPWVANSSVPAGTPTKTTLTVSSTLKVPGGVYPVEILGTYKDNDTGEVATCKTIVTVVVKNLPQCSDTIDNDGDLRIDYNDPGCHFDGDVTNPYSYDPDHDDERNFPPVKPVRKTQCSDRLDNDGDGKTDQADPGCHTDNNANNASSYNPLDDDETDGPTQPPIYEYSLQCSDGEDNDGDGKIDNQDPGCHTDGDASNPASYDPFDNSERDRDIVRSPQCDDNIDNDGDGKRDEADPGCHWDRNPSNPASYDPNHDSELDGSFWPGRPQCSDGVDNDDPEDTLPDQDDPGCHTDGDASNPASFDPNRTSERDRGKINPIYEEN